MGPDEVFERIVHHDRFTTGDPHATIHPTGADREPDRTRAAPTPIGMLAR
jgi:hypothetical protein